MGMVYIVDDNTEFLETIELAAPDHWNVKTFSDPKMALMCLDGDAPSVIISDAQMPGMNGVEFIKIARIACKTAKIILISANPQDEVEKAFGKIGEEMLFFRKPLLDDFDNKVNELLEEANDDARNAGVAYTQANLERLQSIAKALIEHERDLRVKHGENYQDLWNEEQKRRHELLRSNLQVSQFVLGIKDDELENMLEKWRAM